MADFMKDYMRKRRGNPNSKSRFTIDFDKYDHQDVQRLLREMPDFAAYREKLSESAAEDLAYDVWQDLYLSLWKVDPEALPDSAIRATHLINRFVMDEAQKLPDHTELRNWTMGDDIGAALACNALEPDMETIYDRLEEEVKKAQELQEMLQQMAQNEQEQHDLDQMMKDWTEQNPDGEEGEEQKNWNERMQQLQEQMQQMEGQADQAAEELRNMLNNARGSVKEVLQQGMEKAKNDAETISSMAESWGMDPGSLHRLPAAERMAMAQRLNNPKFKKIAELFGPMKRLAFTEQRRKVNYAPEEIFDVELGNNLRRVLPAELLRLADDDRDITFFKDYSQKKLLQYQMRGYERVAKGGIIYCHDGSGSMSGEREVWAKAVGLCLLHIARKQKRPFYAIQFGSGSYGNRPAEIRIDDFRDPQNITPEKVIDFAEFFFGGGTDFMTPLNHAVAILNEEYTKEGRIKSDIVFATDGMCGVTDPWLEEFRKAQEKIGFTVWGIVIGGGRTDEPLSTICSGKVASINTLVNGENVRDIFGGI